MDVEQQARNAAARVLLEVRESRTSTVVSLSADNYRITFSTPNETNIQFYLSGTNLIREYPSGTTAIVASNIGRLFFSKVSQLLTMEVRADKTVYGRTFSYTVIQKVRLRNE